MQKFLRKGWGWGQNCSIFERLGNLALPPPILQSNRQARKYTVRVLGSGGYYTLFNSDKEVFDVKLATACGSWLERIWRW